MKVKMSIHQALGTLKILDERIQKAKEEQFITVKKGESQTIEGVLIDEVIVGLKGNLERALQLINNRKVLRAAVVASNAHSVISIGGKDIIVADAIERKNNLHHEEDLLEELQDQYQGIKNTIDNDEKFELPRKLEAYLSSILGSAKDRKPDDVKALSEEYVKKTGLKIVDPNKLGDFIKNFEKELYEFKTNVDYKLSESNAITFIEVDYVSV